MTAKLQWPLVKENRRADGTPETGAMVERAPVTKTKSCMSADLPKECEGMAHEMMEAKLQRRLAKEDRQADGAPATRAMVETTPVTKKE